MAHTCPICKLAFAHAEPARQCEAWCARHDSCNLEIACQAMNKTSACTAVDERFNGGK